MNFSQIFLLVSVISFNAYSLTLSPGEEANINGTLVQCGDEENQVPVCIIKTNWGNEKQPYFISGDPAPANYNSVESALPRFRYLKSNGVCR